MPTRSDFVPVQDGKQWHAGSQNVGILVVKNSVTGERCVEKRIPIVAIKAGDMEREVKAMRQCPNHTNIVSIIHHDMEYESLQYASIFIEYCELGSLDGLIKRFLERERILHDEGFIWKTLWDLSLALCYLYTGHDDQTTRQRAKQGLPVTPPAAGGWNSIIHRDIKPSNILIKQTNPNGPDSDCVFPTLLLGDLGCSVTMADIMAGQGGLDVLPENDPDFAPPEAPSYSEQGDVYGLGLIIHCLIQMRRLPEKSPLVREMAPLGNKQASDGLYEIVRGCLQRNPASRPTPQDLPRLVWRGYTAWRKGRESEGQPLPAWALEA